jgi:hypothetical protein
LKKPSLELEYAEACADVIEQTSTPGGADLDAGPLEQVETVLESLDTAARVYPA